jgi:DNA-binding FadR family transcriptional regulator
MPSRARHRSYQQPPERKGLQAHVVHDLGSRIVGGEYPPDSRLPGEAVLLERYAVSRPVLREAVRSLAAKGLVLARQRAGVTVRPRTDWHMLDPDVLYWLIHSMPQATFVQTLLTVRRVFEPAAAALAARVADEQAVAGIAQAYAAMEAAQTPDQLLEPDLAFHRRIADATGNELLAYIGNMLTLALRESIALSSSHPRTHELSLPRHKAILAALQARDPLAAQQAALLQLQETGDDLAEVLGTPMNPH